MTDSIFELTNRPAKNLFFSKNDVNDIRLGEIVASDIENYETAEIVVLGCPQDLGVARNGGRIGAAQSPDKIREQFYKLTNFGISRKIFDLGNTLIEGNLETIHERHHTIVKQLLRDGKTIITLGGGNDLSFPDGAAMAEFFGADNWNGFNIDAHFDVRADTPRNSGTPYRQLLEAGFIAAENFYEIGYQPQVNSPIYFEYLQNRGVNLFSLKQLQTVDFTKVCSNLLKTAKTSALFFGFDVDVVRSADAPGVSAANPLGLSSQEFCTLAETVGADSRTKIIEFTEFNPNFDIDGKTAKLVATAMYLFCYSKSLNSKKRTP